MKKLVIATALVLAAATMIMTGCGPKEAEVSAPTRLVVSSRLYSQPGEQQFLIDEVFPVFEEANNAIVMFEILEDDPLLKRAQFQKESRFLSPG